MWKQRTKYLQKHFGVCPRVCCESQNCIPMGAVDAVGISPTYIYCPRCQDMYNPAVSQAMDGGFFGSTFPQVFFMGFPELVSCAPTFKVVPRAYGYRLHPTSPAIPQPIQPEDMIELVDHIIPQELRRKFEEANDVIIPSNSTATSQIPASDEPLVMMVGNRSGKRKHRK